MISSLPPAQDMHPFSKKNPPSPSATSPGDDEEDDDRRRRRRRRQQQQQRQQAQVRGDRDPERDRSAPAVPNPRSLSAGEAASLGLGQRQPPVQPQRQQQIDLVTSALAAELQQLQRIQLLQRQQQQQQQQQQQAAYLLGAYAQPPPLAFGSFPLGVAAGGTAGRIDGAAANAAAVSSLLQDSRASHLLLRQEQQQHQQTQQRLLLREQQAALDAYLRLQHPHQLQSQPHPLSQLPSYRALLHQLLQHQQQQHQQLLLASRLHQASPSPAAVASSAVASSPAAAAAVAAAAAAAPKDPPAASAKKTGNAAAASVSTTTSTTTLTDSRRFPSEREGLQEVAGRCPSPDTARKVLSTIGTTLRSKADKFVDVSHFPIQQGNMNEKRRGASVFFPDILHRLLAEAERDGWATVVGWLPHHRAFRVHNKPRFEREVLPKYFVGQTKWSSFSRQLNLYGWLRVTSGPDYGAYYHELFIRNRPDLHGFMRRVGKPHLMDRRKHKLAEGDDPNFYTMPPVPEAQPLSSLPPPPPQPIVQPRPRPRPQPQPQPQPQPPHPPTATELEGSAAAAAGAAARLGPEETEEMEEAEDDGDDERGSGKGC